jgi:hypothetical protein
MDSLQRNHWAICWIVFMVGKPVKDNENGKYQLALYNNDSIEKCKLRIYESYRFIRYHNDFYRQKTN